MDVLQDEQPHHWEDGQGVYITFTMAANGNGRWAIHGIHGRRAVGAWNKVRRNFFFFFFF